MRNRAFYVEFLPYIGPIWPGYQGDELEGFDTEEEARDRMFDLVSGDLVESCRLYREGRHNLVHEWDAPPLCPSRGF